MQNEFHLFAILWFTHLPVHYPMNRCLPDVYETITFHTRSKYIRDSTAVRDANEVAVLGIFGHKA